MNDDDYTPEEAAQRRDAVIRRMANTPPQHRSTQDRSQKAAKPVAARRRAKKRAKHRA